MSIEAYLTIAGTAHRLILDARPCIEDSATAFPKGPDDTQLVQEVAMCKAIIELARALLSMNLLELDFSPTSRALARSPESLAGCEYDQGTHIEP